MHRSGTSCLAGALQQAGLFLGEVSTSNIYNKKGNREHYELMKLNDLILQYNDATWDNPPLHIIWEQKHIDSGENIILSFKKTWGFKDPRTIITYPFWKSLLKNTHLVGTFRHPLSVVKSLQNRNNKISTEQGLKLWDYYNEKLLEIYEKTPFPLISFDIESKDYIYKLQTISSQFGLKKIDGNSFFDKSLRTHNTSLHTTQLPEKTEAIYKKLNKYSI